VLIFPYIFDVEYQTKVKKNEQELNESWAMLRFVKSFCEPVMLLKIRSKNLSTLTPKGLIRFVPYQSNQKNQNNQSEQKIPHIVKNSTGETMVVITQKVYASDGTKNVDLRESRDWFRVGDKKIHYAFRVVDGELAVNEVTLWVLKNVDQDFHARRLLEKEIVKCFINPESQETFVEYIEKNYGLLITEMFPE
jgi:hypothetical protein